MPKRKANRIDDDNDDEETERMNESQESDSDGDEADREKMKRCEAELVKKVVHCVLEKCTKRGHCRDLDFGGIFTSRNERNMKEVVIRTMRTHLKHVFGIKVDRDEENKKFYISNGLNINFGIQLAEKLEKARKLKAQSSEYGSSDEEENEGTSSMIREKPKRGIDQEPDFENPHFRRWVLTTTLMFIYMTKRHTTTENQMDKGIDGVLIKNYLNNLFETFGVNMLTDKQYGELMGPAKSAQFVSQGWLRREIQNDPATGLEEVFYSWGPHAEMVISKKEMLEEFCRVYGGKAQDWPNHAKVAGIKRIGANK